MYINFGGVIMVATIFVAGMAAGSYIMERRYRKYLNRPKANETTE